MFLKRHAAANDSKGGRVKRQVRVAYIVPAGPRDDVVDTVESIVRAAVVRAVPGG
jgi:hypothetical protein